MIVYVNYYSQQKVEIDDKFNREVDDMSPDEYDNYIDDLMDTLKEKLPDDADIACIATDEDILFED